MLFLYTFVLICSLHGKTTELARTEALDHSSSPKCYFGLLTYVFVYYGFDTWTELNSVLSQQNATALSNQSSIFVKSEQPLVLTSDLNMQAIISLFNIQARSAAHDKPFILNMIKLKGISIYIWLKAYITDNILEFDSLIGRIELRIQKSYIELFVNNNNNCSPNLFPTSETIFNQFKNIRFDYMVKYVGEKSQRQNVCLFIFENAQFNETVALT
jgi:hypothetical protein